MPVENNVKKDGEKKDPPVLAPEEALKGVIPSFKDCPPDCIPKVVNSVVRVLIRSKVSFDQVDSLPLDPTIKPLLKKEFIAIT